MPISVDELNGLIEPNDYGDVARFEFEEELGKFVGEVVHHEFSGLAVSVRQRRIWDLLRERFGEDAQEVSLVLTFSPEEWREITEDAA